MTFMRTLRSTTPSPSAFDILRALTWRMRHWRKPICSRLFCLLVLISPALSHSAEFQRVEEIAPESAVDAPSGVEVMEKVPRKRPVRAFVIKRLEDAPPFWRERALSPRNRE